MQAAISRWLKRRRHFGICKWMRGCLAFASRKAQKIGPSSASAFKHMLYQQVELLECPSISSLSGTTPRQRTHGINKPRVYKYSLVDLTPEYLFLKVEIANSNRYDQHRYYPMKPAYILGDN